MKKLFITLLLCCVAVFGLQAQNTHFLTNETYRDAVTKAFAERDMPASIREKVSNVQDLRQREALIFLYAYMPQSDLMDYDFDYTLQQVNLAFEAQETFHWEIPETLFRHFVLPYRVNNENLDSARAYIFHQLKERLRGMSMYEAALEVNHWCHEHVDYQPADARTSAPLATILTSHGRCGEESTLTVTALRAMGIPARQCYTPRWAHCDDNHAWVEVFVDGKWHFLGACEPDPELDMGWFAVPSSRTMMVHTNVFGLYNGPEEVNRKTKYYSCINVLGNYAETVKMTITVVDENNRPLPDATVRFQLYNYAEYYTLAKRTTNALGEASIITGKGDLLIWVSKDGRYNFAKIDGRTQDHLTIQITDKTPELPPFTIEGNQIQVNTVRLEMNPPIGGTTLHQATPERQQLNDRRKHYEDSLREAYRATWPTKESLAKANYHNANFTDEQLYDIIHRSEGNYKEIMKFLDAHDTVDVHYLLPEYIAALADKDLRDASADVLEAQLGRYRPGFRPKEDFIKGILPARISNEMIRPDRTFLGVCVKHIFRESPTIQQLREFTDTTIVLDNDCNYYGCPISPVGVLEGKRADAHSLGIFFVALCRSFSIPAYMDNSNGELYAWEKGEWQHVTLKQSAQKEAAPEEPQATLILHNPNHYVYYPNYTLQRFENGVYVSYDFEGDARVESDPIVLQLPAGKYCLSTGNRYSNGDVLSDLHFFTMNANDTVEQTITIPTLVPRAHNFGHIDVDQSYVNEKSLQYYMNQSGKDRLILCLVTPGTEPVNHLTKEIEAKQADYEKWNGPMIFVCNNANWKPSKKLPKNLMVTQNNFDNLKAGILHGLAEKQQGENPICIVVDRNGTILFYSEGYHIGLGELLLQE